MPWYLQFDGEDDYAIVPDEVGNCFINDYTLIVEIGEYTDGFCLISRGVSRTRPFLGFSITIESTRIMVERQIGGSDWRRYISGDFSYKGEPFIIAITYTRSSYGLVQAYRGTTLVGSVNTHSQSPIFSSSGYYIGAYRSAYTSYTKGQLYRWSVWNGLLSATQIAAVINKEYGSIPIAPGAIYDIETGNGNILVDSSGNDYHGTIHGATWVWVDEPGQGQKVTGSITFRGRSSMSLAGVKRATGSITFRGQSSTFLSAIKTAVGKITFRGGSFMSLVGLVLRELEGVYQISSSEIVSRNQPVLSTDLANYIEVWINPRVPANQAEEVYRSKEPEPIPPGESKAFNLKLNKEPVIEAVASLEDAGANLAITDTKFYSGSAEITVTNSGATEQTCIIVIQAKPLELQGRRKIVVKDEESILDHGLVKYTFDSPLVQDEESAYDIGRKILWLFSVARANIEIEWRGDPALELADIVQIPEFEKLGVTKKENFYVTRQLLEVVEGGLDATLSGRKVPRLKEGD